MSNSEVNESQKSKWAWGDLWKKLHFGHLSGGENWAGMEAAYRFGLGPYRKFVLKAISARIERKNLLRKLKTTFMEQNIVLMAN